MSPSVDISIYQSTDLSAYQFTNRAGKSIREVRAVKRTSAVNGKIGKNGAPVGGSRWRQRQTDAAKMYAKGRNGKAAKCDNWRNW